MFAVLAVWLMCFVSVVWCMYAARNWCVGGQHHILCSSLNRSFFSNNRLVSRKTLQLVFAPYVACNSSTYLNVTYVVQYHPGLNEQRKEGEVALKAFKGLGLYIAQAAESCPDQPQALKKFNNSEAFSYEKQRLFVFHLFSLNNVEV